MIKGPDIHYTYNRILDVLQLPGNSAAQAQSAHTPDDLHALLALLTDDACQRGMVRDTRGNRDLFDTKLMGALTPPPSMVAERFSEKCQTSPMVAADWFYAFSQDVNYIRTDRIQKDIRWQSVTEYGMLDITINMSKPEKDPRDIAAAKTMPLQGYPRCLLWRGNRRPMPDARTSPPGRTQSHRPAAPVR